MLLVAIFAALFALMVTSVPVARQLLVGNSDILLPAAYTHNLLASPATVAWFQLPRVPSFFPDLALYGVLFAILPSWQDASLAYAVVSFVAVVLAGGSITARLSGQPLSRGTGVFLAVSALAMLLAYAVKGDILTFTYVLAPVVHSGSFVLSLICLLLAARFIRAPSFLAGLGLAGLVALSTLSDKLFVGSFLLPLVAGCVMSWVATGSHRNSSAPAIRSVVLLAVLGCGVALIGDRLLFSSLLFRQPDLVINVAAQLALLPTLLRDLIVHVSLVLAGLTVAFLLPRMRHDPEHAFWSAAGITSVVGFLSLLPVVYADPTSTRYVQPVWWWGMIAIAAALLRAAPRAAPAGVGLAALGAACALLAGDRDVFRPALVTAYRFPATACLADLHARGSIHAGIAGYWTAREVAASSDWTLQLEQVDSTGRAFVWGNNAFYYAHDRADPQRAPLFDYALMRDLDPGAIRGRFGQPSQILSCPGSEVWVYSAPGGIGGNIGGLEIAAAYHGILAGSYCFGSRDLSSRSGTIPFEGVAVSATAKPYEASTWGPYLRLAAGTWTFQFRYSLDGAAKWDVAADAGARVLAHGTLETGPVHSKDIDLVLGRTSDKLEFRTFLDAGAHMRVESLRMTRAGTPAKACTL